VADSRHRVESAETAGLSRLHAVPIPAHVMGPPRFAWPEHRELLRPVHGSWDRGHWRDFIDQGQRVNEPREQAILGFPRANLLSTGLIYDSECLYTLDYFHVPAKLPGSIAPTSRFQILLSLIWRSPPDYNHFVIETLPRLLYCRNLIREHGTALRIPWYYDLSTPWVEQYLMLLELQDLPFITTAWDPVEAFAAELILLPFCYPRDPRTVAYDDPVAWYPLCRDLQRLRALLLTRMTANGGLDLARRPTIIYASRTDVANAKGGTGVGSGGGGRGMVNEEEILSILRRRYGKDLVIFVGRDWDVKSTIDLFARARLVIGPHGGAFVNTLFCAPGTALVEFLPALQPTQHYYRTSVCLSQQYWPLPIRGRGHKDALEVPPSELLRILDAIDSEREQPEPARGF
jgi:hypothetical protein